jgi:hypothetical protein
MADTPSTPDHSDAAEAAAQDPAVSPATAGAEPAPTPTAEVNPEPQPAAAPPDAPFPSVAATTEVPPLPGPEAAGSPDTEEEGGEWNLLVGKVKTWFSSGEPPRQWERLRGPLKGLALLIGLVMALRLYASLVRTIDSIPVVSGLLELTGLIALVRFSLTHLVRRSEREQLFASWAKRWSDFRGRG